MENQWESIFLYASSPPDHPYLPNVEKPVYILGDRYDSIKDRTAIAERLRSLFWMTYRSGFPSIGTQNRHTSDTGWGCMHRCSQMMLAEAIIRVHLGYKWRWTEGCTDMAYCHLRRLFQDHKNSLYSIQNISMVGMAFDKPIGSWFGPNTAVQVIKKLCAYDPRIKWCVHISVEDGIIVDEIKARCHEKVTTSWNTNSEQTTAEPLFEDSVTSEWERGAIKAGFADDTEVIDAFNPQVSEPVTRDVEEGFLEVMSAPTFKFGASSNADASTDADRDSKVERDASDSVHAAADTTTGDEHCTSRPVSPQPQTVNHWCPLLLFIPLRLGLSQPNPCYFDAIKAVLHIKQCIGILGGRPSHAVWIVGVVEDGEDSLLCLDPHITQPVTSDKLNPTDDLTHHCDHPIRMPLRCLDPSLALGFVCPTEADFDQLYACLEREVLSGSEQRYALFELHRTRPSNLPPIPFKSSGGSSGGGGIKSMEDNEYEQQEMDGFGDSVDSQTAKVDADGRLTGAVNAVREIWSKCNRAAGDAVRSFVNRTNQSGASEDSRPNSSS